MLNTEPNIAIHKMYIDERVKTQGPRGYRRGITENYIQTRRENACRKAPGQSTRSTTRCTRRRAPTHDQVPAAPGQQHRHQIGRLVPSQRQQAQLLRSNRRPRAKRRRGGAKRQTHTQTAKRTLRFATARPSAERAASLPIAAPRRRPPLRSSWHPPGIRQPFGHQPAMSRSGEGRAGFNPDDHHGGDASHASR